MMVPDPMKFIAQLLFEIEEKDRHIAALKLREEK